MKDDAVENKTHDDDDQPYVLNNIWGPLKRIVLQTHSTRQAYNDQSIDSKLKYLNEIVRESKQKFFIFITSITFEFLFDLLLLLFLLIS